MKKTSVEVKCGHCGSMFETHAYRIKRGTGKYCTRACYLAFRWGEGGKCKYCGADCQTRFCSKSCQKLYWDKNGHDIYQRNNRYWKRKLAIIESLGGKCVKCGFSDHRAIDINHIDPSTKVRPRGGQYTWSRRFKDWDANAGNLELLCANCHRLHTWEQRGFGPT